MFDDPRRFLLQDLSFRFKTKAIYVYVLGQKLPKKTPETTAIHDSSSGATQHDHRSNRICWRQFHIGFCTAMYYPGLQVTGTITIN